MADDNTWKDNEFDNEFEDDNDDEFNKSGGGWEQSDEDPFDVDDPNGGWGTDPTEDVDNNPDADIENKYWEGYYESDDKQAALQSFLKVIGLINAGGQDTEDFKFKSLTQIVILYFDINDATQSIAYFKQFLKASTTVKPKELDDNLRKILNAVRADVNVYNELHDLTMNEFKPSKTEYAGSIKHLWFELGIERCHDFMDRKVYGKCENLVEELHESVQDKGVDDTSQTAKLLQVYAVKIQLTVSLIEDLAIGAEVDMDRFNELQFRLRELIDITRGLMTNVDITDNKAMSIIYECWGKVYASNNDWSNSYKYFKEAFLLYQQIAHKNTTKCLKYLLIAYMILSSLPTDDETADKIPNPFAMDEIKVYQNHQDIISMNNLVNAFENDDITQFNKILPQQYATDAFIVKYLSVVQLRLQGKALCNLVKSYTRIKLGWLCKKLGMSMAGIEKLIVKLIVDAELKGRLDQVNMVLILHERDNKTNAILNSMTTWLKSVNNLRNTLNSRIANKTTQTGFGGMMGMGMTADYFHHDIDDDDLYIMDSPFLSWN